MKKEMPKKTNEIFDRFGWEWNEAKIRYYAKYSGYSFDKLMSFSNDRVYEIAKDIDMKALYGKIKKLDDWLEDGNGKKYNVFGYKSSESFASESVTSWWTDLHDYSKMKILSSIGESPNPDIKYNELSEDIQNRIFQMYSEGYDL